MYRQTQWSVWGRYLSRMRQPICRLRIGFGPYWAIPPADSDSGLEHTVPGLEELEVVFYRKKDLGADGGEEEFVNEYAKEKVCEWLLNGFGDGAKVVFL